MFYSSHWKNGGLPYAGVILDIVVPSQSPTALGYDAHFTGEELGSYTKKLAKITPLFSTKLPDLKSVFSAIASMQAAPTCLCLGRIVGHKLCLLLQQHQIKSTHFLKHV